MDKMERYKAGGLILGHFMGTTALMAAYATFVGMALAAATKVIIGMDDQRLPFLEAPLDTIFWLAFVAMLAWLLPPKIFELYISLNNDLEPMAQEREEYWTE